MRIWAGEATSAQVLVRFADNTVGNIVTSWAYDPPASTEKFSVVAEKGTLWSDGHTLHHRRVNGELTTIEFPDIQDIPAEIAAFITCVTDGCRPINTEVEGVKVLKTILGAYASVHQKRVIALADL